jgi:glycosyltransferase involved in cell wall biosynthesis
MRVKEGCTPEGPRVKKAHPAPVRPAPRGAKAPRLLSVVCPAYNEAACLPLFHERVARVLGELGQPHETVYVNDGSTDATLSVMRALRRGDPSTAVIDLSRNFGKEVALTAGLDAARGDAVVVIDADLQDPPELIGALIEGWAEGYDVVYATRRLRRGEGLLKRATAGAFYRLLGRLSRVPVPQNTGDFRLMSRVAVDAVRELREQHRFMKGLFAWAGFPSKQVLYDRDPRAAGSTKWNYRKLWRLSLEGITASTTAPLTASTYIGFAVALLSVCAGTFYAGKAILVGEPVAGFPTLITTMLFLGGVQLTVLGVIGEYLGRVFNETKARPLYFVREELPAARAPAGGTAQPQGARALIEEAERRLGALR